LSRPHEYRSHSSQPFLRIIVNLNIYEFKNFLHQATGGLESSRRLVQGWQVAPPGCGSGRGSHAGGRRRDRRHLCRCWKYYEIHPPPMAHIPLVADWQTAYSSGLQPSTTVGAALFPAISGKRGVRLQCNFGLDPRRPLLFPPSKNSQHEQVLLPWTYIL
jgi:hypothetical protein